MNSKTCPHCGEQPESWATGGEIIEGQDDIDLPSSDEDFDYDEFVAREFDDQGKQRSDWDPRGSTIKPIWIYTALGLFVVLLILVLSGLW